MSSASNSEMEKSAQEVSLLERSFDAVWWRAHSNMLGLTIVLLLVLGYLGVKLYQPLFSPASDTLDSPNMPTTMLQNNMFVPSPSQPSVFYYVGTEKNTSDIYQMSRSLTSTLVINLTRSPQYWEFWPSPAPNDGRLAFMALSTIGERSLRVLEPAGVTLDVTYSTGDSGLGDKYRIALSSAPQWSPDGVWLAFLGELNQPDSDVLELFIVKAQTPPVYRITTKMSKIGAFQWLDNDSIVFSVSRQNGTFELFEIATSPLPGQLRQVPFQTP